MADLVKKVYKVDENGENPVYQYHWYVDDEHVFHDGSKINNLLSVLRDDIVHVNVPDGMDMMAAVPAAKYREGQTSEGHVITADNRGGENIVLSCDGVATIGTIVGDHNTNDPANPLSITSGNGADVVLAQNVVISGGKEYEHILDQPMQDVLDKDALSEQYFKDVYDELETRFGTRSDVSVNADYQTWIRMVANPSVFSAASPTLKVKIDTASFDVGDDLDTDQKVTDYATECIALVDAYAIWRDQRKQTYLDAVAAI